eukprot:5589144-Pyramimonas_sp.AAC.1
MQRVTSEDAFASPAFEAFFGEVRVPQFLARSSRELKLFSSSRPELLPRSGVLCQAAAIYSTGVKKITIGAACGISQVSNRNQYTEECGLAFFL